MRFLSSVPLVGAVCCISCAPAEVPRPAIPQEQKISAPPVADTSKSSGVASTPAGEIESGSGDSARLNTLRDSLSVVGNPEPKVPMVFTDACPGEVCTFGAWIACRSIPILSEPRRDAPVAFTLHRSDTLVTMTGNLIVERAGKVIFRDTVRVRGEGQRYVFTPADTLYPLSYDGEGEGRWFFHGRIRSADWFLQEWKDADHNPNVVIARELLTRWWVKTTNAAGKEGWFEFQPGIAVDTEDHYGNSCPSQ
ncbi:MAG: hypothetical protein M3P12_02750 [Gemmatimonadota bacterium]|nr:hypothetical protein [Gemmatimonadota bacterium]